MDQQGRMSRRNEPPEATLSRRSLMSGSAAMSLALLASARGASANEYAGKTITLVAGFPPGGEVDCIATNAASFARRPDMVTATNRIFQLQPARRMAKRYNSSSQKMVK